MESDLFEHLAINGFGKRRVSRKTLLSLQEDWSADDVMDFCWDMYHALPKADSQAGSLFDLVTGARFGGSPLECGLRECRIGGVEDLAKFASLYSDHLIVPHPFENLLFFQDDPNIDFVAEEASIYVEMLYRIRPLVDGGILKFAPLNMLLCRECSQRVRGQLGEGNKRHLEAIEEYVFRRYMGEVQFVLDSSPGLSFLEITGPKDLVEHGCLYIHFKKYVPEDLVGFLDQVPVAIPDDNPTKIGVARSFSSKIVGDLSIQNYYSRVSGYSYLAESDSDIALFSALQELSGSSDWCRSLNPITHKLPMIDNVDVSSLVQLREREEEAFSVYRDAISKIVSEHRNESDRSLKSAFDDLVRPELNKIERAVRVHRDRMAAKLVKDIGLSAGFIGIGLFGGFLPADIGKLVGALGGYHFASSLGGDAVSAFSDPEEVKQNPFYFYWKAKRLERKH